MFAFTQCSSSVKPDVSDVTLKKIISDQYKASFKKEGAGDVIIDSINLTSKLVLKNNPVIYSVEYYISGSIFSGAKSDTANKVPVRFSKNESAEIQVKDDSTGNWINGVTFP